LTKNFSLHRAWLVAAVAFASLALASAGSAQPQTSLLPTGWDA